MGTQSITASLSRSDVPWLPLTGVLSVGQPYHRPAGQREVMQVRVRQKFTEAGGLGAALIVVGPAVTGLAYAAIASSRQSFGGIAPDVSWLYLVAAAGLCATALSFPLMLVGRRYILETSDADAKLPGHEPPTS
jgi:hypothetical protein